MFSILGKITPFIYGLLGMLLALAIVHGYQDHKTYHELINALVQRNQTQQAKPTN